MATSRPARSRWFASGRLLTAHGKGSGVPAELRYWALYWIRDGKIARRQVFWNKAEALEAAGLRE